MKFLLPLFLCSSLFAQNITNLYVGQQLSVGMQLTTVPSAAVPSLTCQSFVNCLGYYNNGGAGGTYAQEFVSPPGGCEVCSFSFYCGNGNTAATASIWSSPNGTGTQYGTVSIATDNSGGGVALYTWTWASNPVIPGSTTFYVIVSYAYNFQVAPLTSYPGHSGYQNGSSLTVPLRCSLSTMQP